MFLKCAVIIAILFAGNSSYSQFRYDWRSEVDLIIQQADSLSLKSQRTFSLLKPYHQDKDVRENWYYTTRDGRVIIFEIQYVIDSTEFSEIYYMHKGRLICMEQYEAPYLSVYADQLKRGESYFFLDNALKQYIVTGKGRPSRDYGVTALNQWQSSTSDLQNCNVIFHTSDDLTRWPAIKHNKLKTASKLSLIQ